MLKAAEFLGTHENAINNKYQKLKTPAKKFNWRLSLKLI
jgi:hypothetical protein